MKAAKKARRKIVGIEGIDALKPGEDAPDDSNRNANGFSSAHTVEELLGMLAGSASVCWEKPEGAGIFDSTQASRFIDEAVARLHEIVPLHHDDETLRVVHHAMTQVGISSKAAQDAVMQMQNNGIYFREVKQ